jgi:hypothetical protein
MVINFKQNFLDTFFYLISNRLGTAINLLTKYPIPASQGSKYFGKPSFADDNGSVFLLMRREALNT